MTSLILPAAGFSSRYPNVRPKWMLTHPQGPLMLLKSISGLDLNAVDSIYVTILDQHQKKYNCIEGIEKGFNQAGLLDKLESITVLPNPTKHQPQTVAETIRTNKITGPIYIKDTDNFFVSNVNGDNCVSVYSLESMGSVNAANKSYVQTTEGVITNIIEKRIISPLFCCGGYGFESADTYLEQYEHVKDKDAYVSHIIYKMMLEGIPFKAIEATDYEDWGTLEDWLNYQRQFGAVFVDIDGLLVENSGEYFPPIWGSTGPIQENVDKINELYNGGGIRVILTTSRRSAYRMATEKQLERCGIQYHQMLMDIPHGKRYILNDYAPSNPHPSCIAINTPRNGTIVDKIDIPVKAIETPRPKPPTKTKKRIAICLSGLTRTYEKTLENFRKMMMVEPHQYDIFISTWSKNDSRTSTEVVVRKQVFDDSKALIDRLAEEFGPRLIEFEPEFTWDANLLHKLKQHKRTDTYVPSTLFMLYKIWAADQMRRRYEDLHGFKYDVVVRTRFDLRFEEPMRYELGDDNICLPKMKAGACEQLGLPWINDTFAYGDSDSIAVYCDLFKNIEQLFDDGVPFQPEIMLLEWLKRNGMSCRNDCPYPRLVRVSGQVTPI